MRGDFLEGHSYASRCHFYLFPSTKTPILCSGGLVCALSAGQQPAGSRKHPAGNQKKTSGKQNTLPTTRKRPSATRKRPSATRKRQPATKTPPDGHQKPTAWYQKSLPEPRDRLPADLYANKKCIADYCSLSPFIEMRNSWLLIVFSSLFFINSIASTLFISAR